MRENPRARPRLPDEATRDSEAVPGTGGGAGDYELARLSLQGFVSSINPAIWR
jgi:hypothetical protein